MALRKKRENAQFYFAQMHELVNSLENFQRKFQPGRMPDFDFAEIIEYLEEKGLSKFQRFFIVVF
jgi:hypothetical protein